MLRYLNTALVACGAALAFWYARGIVEAFLIAIAVQVWIAARNAWTGTAQHGSASGSGEPEILEILGVVLTIGTWAGFAWIAFRQLTA